MPKFGGKLMFRLHPLHNGEAATARLSEEDPHCLWSDPSCTIWSDLKTNGFSQVALRLRMTGFSAKWPNCKNLNVTITHYDGMVEKFSHEVFRDGYDSFLGRPVRLAAEDGSFSGEVKIRIEPDGNTVPSGEHSYVAMFRYSPSNLCHRSLDDRVKALWACKAGYSHPHFGKEWLSFRPIAPAYQDSTLYRSPAPATATSYEAPRPNEPPEASVSRSNTERSSSSTPAPVFRSQTSNSTSEHRNVSVQARSPSISGLSSRVSVTYAGSPTAASSTPALAMTSRPTTPATHSSQIEPPRPSSAARPSGEDLRRTIEAQRRQIEELRREEAEAQRREEEEEEARRRAEEEVARFRAAEARRKQQEEEARRQAEEAKRKEEEARRRRDEEVRRQAEQETRRQEAKATQARREAEEQKKRQEEQARLFEEYQAAQREAKLLEEFEAQQKEYQALLERKNLRVAASQSQAAAFYPTARSSGPRDGTSPRPNGPVASSLQPPTGTRLAQPSIASDLASREPSQSRQAEPQLQDRVPLAVGDAVTTRNRSGASPVRIDARPSRVPSPPNGSSHLSTGQGRVPGESSVPISSIKRTPLAAEETFRSAKRRRIEQDNQLDETYTTTRPIKMSQSPPPYTPMASDPPNAVGGDGRASSGREYWQALFVQSSRPA